MSALEVAIERKKQVVDRMDPSKLAQAYQTQESMILQHIHDKETLADLLNGLLIELNYIGSKIGKPSRNLDSFA